MGTDSESNVGSDSRITAHNNRIRRKHPRTRNVIERLAINTLEQVLVARVLDVRGSGLNRGGRSNRIGVCHELLMTLTASKGEQAFSSPWSAVL